MPTPQLTATTDAWLEVWLHSPGSVETHPSPRTSTLAVAEMPSTPTTDTIQEPTQRIRRDFCLLPGLALTLPQARRLWALQESACRELLDALVAEGFLRVRSDARYVMREASRWRMQG